MVDFKVPLPQLLTLAGLALAFLGAVGARGTVREISVDLSPVLNRAIAVLFGLLLVVLGVRYSALFGQEDAPATPTATVVALAAASSEPPVLPTPAPPASPTPAATVSP